MTSDDSILPGAVAREELHARHIELRGYKRCDGLFEVEARLQDRKPHDFRPPSDVRVIPANEPVHDLGLCVVFDEEMVIRAVRTIAKAAPYQECVGGGHSLQALVGRRIGPGWSQMVRKCLTPSETCTHLRELLIPLATAAYQSMTVMKLDQVMAMAADGIDSCYAYSASRELVRKRWPDFHRAAAEDD
jgi:hypothetical protein